MNPRDTRVDDTSVERAAPGECPPHPASLGAEKLMAGWQPNDIPSGAPALPQKTVGTRGAADQAADHEIVQRVVERGR